MAKSAGASLLALSLVTAACSWGPRVADAPAASETPARAARPTLSAADGLVYAVASNPENPRHTDLWRARLSDGAVRPLIETPGRQEDQPSWSERASELVFEARPLRSAAKVRSGLVLWREGTEIELPGARARRELWATWAPLGSRLAYSVRKFRSPDVDAPVPNGIAVLDVATGEQVLLARGKRGESYNRPAFAPDGRRVAAEYRTRSPHSTRIVLFHSEGEPRILTGEDYRAEQPRFTRDGRHIVFSRRNSRDDPRDVMRVQADGSGVRLLAGTPDSDDYQPIVSPVRDEVAFLSDRDGKLDVFIVDLMGGTPRNLTSSLDVRVRRLRWSPDGEHLALTAFPYVRGAPEAEQPDVTPATGLVLVLDRKGRIVFQTSGVAPDWMPPWS